MDDPTTPRVAVAVVGSPLRITGQPSGPARTVRGVRAPVQQPAHKEIRRERNYRAAVPIRPYLRPDLANTREPRCCREGRRHHLIRQPGPQRAGAFGELSSAQLACPEGPLQRADLPFDAELLGNLHGGGRAVQQRAVEVEEVQPGAGA